MESACVTNGLIASPRQCLGVRIDGADDHSFMRGVGGTMQAHEMEEIECQHRTAFAGGKLKHFLVRDALVGTASFQGSQHIMAERAQGLDNASVKVLVGVESC